MHLVSCEHPVRVYNKYLNEYFWVPCKHCDTCLKRYQAYWCSRLESERKTSLFVLFVTLTYSNDYLPVLKRKDVLTRDGLIEAYSDADETFCIPFKDFKFDSKADLNYFNSKMSTGGVPYAKFRDVQLFLKRYRKFLFNNYTKKYENFRYFIVSELGKESLRPHYHGLFFFKSKIEAKDFEADISSCWKLGRCKVEVVESSASSYVSKYVGKPAFYPSFYQHNKIRPKFICSKHSPIGSEFELSESSSEIFHNAATSIPRPSNVSSEISFSPLPTYVENRLFPKCYRFASLSHSCRVELYRCASRFVQRSIGKEIGDHNYWIPPFDYWLENVKCSVGSKLYRRNGASQLYYLLSEIANGFSERGINALRRLYYMSKRIIRNCEKFYCTMEYYVLKIEEYWNKKEYETLTKFFDFQRVFAEKENPEELVNCYLEYNFQFPSDLPALSECRDYKVMCAENKLKRSLDLFSHFKNALIDSCRCVDRLSKKITLDFYYAQKCNEVIEAVT